MEIKKYLSILKSNISYSLSFTFFIGLSLIMPLFSALPSEKKFLALIVSISYYIACFVFYVYRIKDKSNKIDRVIYYVLELLKVVVFALFSFYLLSYSYDVNRVVYHHKDNNSVVIFQGMTHFSNNDFYNVVNKDIENLKNDDYIHLYEMISVLPQHKGLFDSGVSKMFKDIIPIDFDSQSKSFKMHEDDINADVDSNFIVNSGLKDNNLIINKEAMIDIFKSEVTSTRFLIFSLNLGNILGSDTMLKVLDYVNDTNIHDIVIVERNKVAVKHIIDQVALDHKKIVISYGDAHFDGINELLIKEGYIIKETKKITSLINK